jgi:hypothetical protein
VGESSSAQCAAAAEEVGAGVQYKEIFYNKAAEGGAWGRAWTRETAFDASWKRCFLIAPVASVWLLDYLLYLLYWYLRY